MTRSVFSAAIDSEWKLVSHGKPCPVCGGGDGCSVHTVDDFACCSREPSDWKLTNGAWLHRTRTSGSVPKMPEVITSGSSIANGNGSRL